MEAVLTACSLSCCNCYASGTLKRRCCRMSRIKVWLVKNVTKEKDSENKKKLRDEFKTLDSGKLA